MGTRTKRLLSFFIVAAVLYTIAFAAGADAGVAFLVVVTAAAFAEIGFWLELFGLRKS